RHNSGPEDADSKLLISLRKSEHTPGKYEKSYREIWQQKRGDPHVRIVERGLNLTGTKGGGTRALVNDPKTRVIAFEALEVKNMTARPKPKQDENGQWLKNGAAAKAGLNTAILGSDWGKVYDFTRYKALRAGKLTVKVSAPGSSQECAHCGHTHPDNRPSQAVFVCQRCGHARNADENASQVIKQRGIQVVLSGKWREKPPKKTLRLKSQSVGSERPEPDPAIDTCSQEPTPVEIQIRHGQSIPLSVHGSLNQETPATARSA
ncbi:MAG: zinc ribbon domain-containing protein, partial [Steroidobacteraceae bacterium]